MNFEIVHTFEAERERVERAMFDPRLSGYLTRRMTLVREIQLLDKREDDGGRLVRRVRYVPAPMIRKVGAMPVRPEWMSWTEESSFEPGAHRVEYANVPTVPAVAELMEQRGEIRFEKDGPGRTRRVIRGTLRIKMPMVGGAVERLIYPNAARILDEEAQALAAWLAKGEA